MKSLVRPGFKPGALLLLIWIKNLLTGASLSLFIEYIECFCDISPSRQSVPLHNGPGRRLRAGGVSGEFHNLLDSSYVFGKVGFGSSANTTWQLRGFLAAELWISLLKPGRALLHMAGSLHGWDIKGLSVYFGHLADGVPGAFSVQPPPKTLRKLEKEA